jgi:anti-sigma factor RsiW
MECVRAKKLLSDYLDGILDTHSVEQLERHLSGCKKCRRQRDALKALVGELNRLEPVKPPHDFLDQIHKRLEPRTLLDTVVKKLFFPLRIKLPLELATAVAIAVIIVGVIRIQNNEISTRQPSPVSISRSVAEQKQDSKRVSRKLRKAETRSVSEDIASHKKVIAKQPIVLALVVKYGTSVPGETPPGVQPSPSAQSGKTASVADEENRSVSYFSRPQRASEPPAKDSVTRVAPGVSMSKDNRPVEEKSRSYLNETRYRVKRLVQALEGKVLRGKDDPPAPEQQTMTVNLPAGRYDEFIRQLEHIAPFQTPPPSPPPGQPLIRVEIRLISVN